MDTESAEAAPRSPVSVAVTARGHTVVQDKMQGSGGKDEGMMASELLLAAVLACQHSTCVKVAAKRRMEVRIHRLRGEMDFRDGDIAAIRVHFELAAPGASPEGLATLLRLTDKACTISQALKVPVQADYSLVAAGEPASMAS